MPINVYAWPPVYAVSWEWTTVAPVARLRSALTGREVIQASQRARRVATVEVSSRGRLRREPLRARMGAGYCEMLKQYLAGGIHAVRLTSYPVNWWQDDKKRRGSSMNSTHLPWQTSGNPLGWTAPTDPLGWFVGTVITGGAPVMSDGFPQLRVDGLPRNTLVARPGDFIRIYDIADPSVSEVARVVKPAMTNGSGIVWLRLDRMPTISGGRVNMAGQDEAVFRVDGDLPRAVQPVNGDWSYTWKFREVFADEVGGFTEVNPWI